jgi:maleylpyruvate isomerase
MRPVTVMLDELHAATADLLADITGLTDDQARQPSLLPGWTRGHVLTHLARNAEGGTRLLVWARTGIPSYEYQSVPARGAAIEAGAGRPAAQLVDDARATAAGLADAAAAMSPDAWQHPVTWTTGEQTPAEMVIWSREAEVLLHHMDLALGYGPASWPVAYVQEAMDAVVESLTRRELTPLAARLEATDTGRAFRLGDDAAGASTISGAEGDLLAWLMGRTDGADLDREHRGPLPPMPSVYRV